MSEFSPTPNSEVEKTHQTDALNEGTSVLTVLLDSYQEYLEKLSTTGQKLQNLEREWVQQSHEEEQVREQFKEIVKDTLLIRDQIEQVLLFDKRGSSQAEIQRIEQLDKQLEQHSKLIRAEAGLGSLKKLLQPKSQGWWWNPPHPWDDWDPVWKFLTIFFMTASLVFAVNLFPRFWAGGPSLPGAAVAVIPGLFALLLSKDFFEKIIPSPESLDKLLEKVRIPDFLRQELTLVFSFVLFVCMLIPTLSSNQIADYFYHKAYKNTEDKSALEDPAEAESNFKRAIAFNPDHAQAHFELAWLYESRQDLDKAKDEYKAAMQSGSLQSESLLARARLAGIYLRENKLESANTAVSVLLDGFGQKERMQERTEETSAEIKEKFLTEASIKSWYTVLGWARVQQGRYGEAEEELDKAIEMISQLVKEALPGYPPIGHVAYCVRAELYDKQAEQLNQQAKSLQEQADRLSKQDKSSNTQEKVRGTVKKISSVVLGKALNSKVEVLTNDAQDDWKVCKKNTSSLDPDEDIWNGKARKKIKD